MVPAVQIFTAISLLAFTYCSARAIYNAYFHPLAKYPGPKLAAMSSLWWVYASLSGRYPWIIEKVIKKYGHVVRIGPNQLVFLTPQAAKDIYLAQEKNMELFVQVGYDALDTGDGGISGETSPARHREIAKKLAPAFSNRSLKTKEAVIHQYLDLFVRRLAEHGGDDGVELNRWTNWLGLDMAAALTYRADMGHLREMKDSPTLTAVLRCNLMVMMSQITRKLPLLLPLQFLCIPPSVLFLFPKLIKIHAQNVKHRIETHTATMASSGTDSRHVDYLDQLLGSNPKQLLHIENVSSQLLLATWQPLTSQFYAIILSLISSTKTLDHLTTEIRTTLQTYQSITLDSVSSLKYLSASRGNIPIDGLHVPKGTICQIAYFAAQRHPDYFTDGKEFRPERWLPPTHPLYDERYKDDDLKVSKPFSQGPRGCPGGAIARGVISLFVAKLLWRFDLEAVEGKELPDFDKDLRVWGFWERHVLKPGPILQPILLLNPLSLIIYPPPPRQNRCIPITLISLLMSLFFPCNGIINPLLNIFNTVPVKVFSAVIPAVR
ncbi:cytochrome P450 [Rhypophila decipiens]|uniref:Cytochrome P450 n=1 Tax=Rhypophila decipiens TaxID=261697 RepID=A0AAN6YDZ5_9PEZI|nr:cytochrome P450 [Rhypophila decipiens]